MTAASDANREFYDSAQPGRDDYWRKMAAPRARVSELLSLVRELAPRRVVDLGSGGGQLLAEIRALHPALELSGVDISAAQLAANASRYPDVRWHQLDLDADVTGVLSPLLVGAFDLVLASEIIEHLDHPEVFLANALALASPAGHLLLSTQSGPVRETEKRVGHRRHFRPSEMEDILRRAGWEPLRVWNAGFPFHDASKWYANLDPDASMNRFAGRPYGLREDLVCAALRLAFRFNSRHRGAQLFAVARRSEVPR